jgi:hypothetical protein
VDVYREAADIAKAVPDRSSHGQVDRFDFDSESKAVEFVCFGHIGFHDAKRS